MLIFHLTKSEKNKKTIFPTFPKKSIKCINVGSLAQSYHKS